MIVSCPACSARYKIDPSKIKGRGAKITCPRCGHKFVVYKDRPQTSSIDLPQQTMRSTTGIGTRDFRRVGVTWRVRKAIGVTYSFHDLATLEKHIEAGRVEGRDVLSYDARTWVPIDSLDDLGAYFEDIWRMAERGEIAGPAPSRNSEDEAEAPTTIMGHGHALMDDIRKAVAEATTPPPSPQRSLDPGWSPAPAVPRPHAELTADDPTTFSRRGREEPSDLTPSTSDVRGHGPPEAAGYGQGTHSGSPRQTPAPKPAPTHEDGRDLDNTVVLVTAIVAIVVVILVMGLGLWWAGVLPRNGASGAPGNGASSGQVMPQPPPSAPAPGATEGGAGDVPGTASPPPEGAATGGASGAGDATTEPPQP